MLNKWMTRAEALVRTQAKHQDYDHVVELTEMYYTPFITGKDTDHLFRQFNQRESDAEFNQRKRITQLITPAVCNTLMTPANKIAGVVPLINDVSYNDDTSGGEKKKDALKQIQENVHKFYGDRSLDYYLDEKMIKGSYKDPNAFLVMDFKQEETGKKPRVYGTIISSRDAWNFEYQNNILQWLLVHRDIKIKVKWGTTTRDIDAHYFIMYLDQDQIEFTQVDHNRYESLAKKGIYVMTEAGYQPIDLEEIAANPDADWIYGDDLIYKVDNTRVYQVKVFHPKAEGVQAIRIGFIPDAYTDGRTCVNGFHAAMPYLMKSIKAVSELDLSSALHAFMQKISYYPPCQGADGAGSCMSGQTPSGDKCSICDGRGYLLPHKSSQDHIGMALPSDKEEIFDLNNLVRYVDLPVDIIKWQDEYVDKLERKCLKAVYNSNMFSKDQVTPTATEVNVDLQSVNDALQPMAEHYATIRVFAVKKIATFKGLAPGLQVTFKFPKKFKLESVDLILQQMEKAQKAGASAAIVNQLNSDLMQHLYADNPRALKEAQVHQLFNPFTGKTENEIMQIMSLGTVTLKTRVMWAELDRVLTEVVEEEATAGRDFYMLTYEKQKQLVDAKVQQIIEVIQEESPMPTISFADN